jgi:hypothetical membrane protein
MLTANRMTTVRAVSDRSRQLAGLALFVLAAQFLIVIMAGASIAPNYDDAGGAISDLGVIAATAPLFNASLIVVGVLNILGGYLLYRIHRKAWCFAVFVVAGIGALGAGVFTLESGGLHGVAALLAFVFFNVEAIAVGTLIRGWMRPISLIAGAIGMVFVALMLVGDSGNPAAFGPIGHGGTERMIVYPAMIWLLALGGYLMASMADADPASDRGRPL